MTIVVFDFYHAEIEHRSGAYPGVTTSRIDFKADSVSDAARAVKRYSENRRYNVPEFFGEVLCVKIYPRSLGEIDADGYLMTRLGMHLFEWKIDMGWTYEQRVDRAEGFEKKRLEGRTI
jgi:hypothetical protein